MCNTFRGTTPYPVDIVRMFNFSDEIRKRIVHCPLKDLYPSADVSTASNELLEECPSSQ